MQCPGQLAGFVNAHRGGTILSPAVLGAIGREYMQAIDRFVADRGIAKLRFAKRDRKEDVARPYLQAAERAGRFGVVLVGVAQEKAYAWKGWRDGGNDARPHFEFARQAVFVNHYHFHILDPDWGPGFIKANAPAPYPIWVYLNGHRWAKRQAARGRDRLRIKQAAIAA